MAEGFQRQYDDEGRPIYDESDRRIDLAELFKHSPEKPQYSLTEYVPPGPVAAAFIEDMASLGKAITGPFGSGKTTACIFARLMCGVAMPVCLDKVRRDRFVVVRDSFRNIEKTVLASWLQWFPKTYPGSSWSGGNDRPAVHTLRFQTEDGVRNEFITEFIGLGGQKAGTALRGYEPSGGWVNELDLCEEDVWDTLSGRLGRYPRVDLLPPDTPRPKFMIGDMNVPAIGHWAHTKFYMELPDRYGFYRQPSGLSEAAENVKATALNKAGWAGGLDAGYYEDVAVGKKKWWVKKYIEARPGYDRSSEPVYENFDEDVHVARKLLDPIPELPVLVGLDQGLNPAAVFFQELPNGQIRVTDELYQGSGFGPARFGAALNEVLRRRYPFVRDLRLWGDPAGLYGADTEGGELAWLEAIMLAIGWPIRVPNGGSNELAPRIEALALPLGTMIEPGVPGLIVSPHCRMIIEGMAGKYRWAEQQVSGDTRRGAIVKNAWSHPVEALQYGVLGYRGLAGVIADAARGGRAGAVRAIAPPDRTRRRGEFDVHSV